MLLYSEAIGVIQRKTDYMIYLKIAGRIGNQLFMYAVARTIQVITGDCQEIVIEDYGNRAHDTSQVYENSLVKYKLKNNEGNKDESEEKHSKTSRNAWEYAKKQL